MTSSVTNTVKAFALITLGLAIGAMGIYVGEVDDAPGAGGIGLLLMLAGIWLGVKAARNRLPTWAGRAALVVGVIAAAFAAALTYGVSVAAPLFAQPADVPSVAVPGTQPASTTTVDRARLLVRAAIGDQNLPGVSIAVGIGTDIVWAEGFGWRDVGTRTPVTPATRFNVGTAASAITAAPIASLGMTNTGTDEAFAWSPEAIGEPGEDFPVFTLIRHGILQPIGLVASEYPLPGDRATFYVPRSDDNDTRRGRRLMFMRDLACCADGMAFYSTPSDLVRFALATGADSANGNLAGGSVMSLVTRRDKGMAVAVTSNVAYANTADLARSVADVFAGEK
jgi:hypothetical protein